MGFRERLHELQSVEDVQAFLEKHPTCALFKAGGCHKTMQGFGYVEEALNPRDHLQVGFVRVIENRPASNYIAEITNVIHQSPQLILMIDGTPVFDIDNWDITREVVEEVLENHFGPNTQASETDSTVSRENLTPYIELIHQFLSGQISQEEFENLWLQMFQLDSTLRSTKEFEVLNSLFGDVDAAIAEKESFPAYGPLDDYSESLKIKAQQLMAELQKL